MKVSSMASRFLEPKKVKLFLRTFQTGTIKKQTEIAASIVDGEEIDSEYEAARPFESIPGPKPLPIPRIGNMWRMLPFGTYGKMDILEIHKKLQEEYGPIVRFVGLGNYDQVVLFEPEIAEKMFRNESIWPNRYFIPSLKYYRTVVRKDFYEDCEGLVTSNGEKWHDFRTNTNQAMMNPRNVKLYLESVANVCDDFLERIRYIRKPNDEMPDNFLHEINKLSLETFGFITLDTRLGCLKNDLAPDSDAMKMINNVKETMFLMYELDLKPSLWQYFPTRKWKRFVKGMDESLEFSVKHINAKWEKIKAENESESSTRNKSVLENILLKTKNPKIAVVMASDTIFAGIETTSNTIGTILYYLAINPEKQEKLHQDLKRLLPQKNTQITDEILKELKYTRAVIKESMRMHPTTPANQRNSVKNLVLYNYQIPKGSNILVNHWVMGQDSKHFKSPYEFLPERWLKAESQSEISSKNTHPFAYLPFGFGPRSCIGKRFAYLEMDVAVTKIIRNFKLTYDYEPMTWITGLTSTPTKPLKFKMTERPE